MIVNEYKLPHWVTLIAFYSSITATCIIFASIYLHLINYRRPYQQRLIIRIQLIVPLFALSCYSMLINSESYLNKFVLEPLREVYEAFVIYTFFSLLTDTLGGERSIIIMTSGRKPVSHPGVLRFIFPDVDISDPTSFLIIKRGILQYVWLKPFLCFGTILTEITGYYNVNRVNVESIYLWLMIFYNFSVTMSLYCLAMFWKILWNDLKPFNPVGKFLCVKLIIFASYWQGILLALLNFFHVLPGSSNDDDSDKKNTNVGISIQNALLCMELTAFAIGHWFSFSYVPFTISNIPNGRLQFYYAVRDMFGIKDLIQDFKMTYNGDYYKDYRSFDSVNAIVAHPTSRSRLKKINQGLRYYNDGKQKHWLLLASDHKSIKENGTIGDESLYAPSIKSLGTTATNGTIGTNGTSTKGLYSTSPKNLASPKQSPPPSPFELEMAGFPITETLNNDEFNYDNELLDEDESLYHLSYNAINNYRLDQSQVKKLINYPIIDNVIDSHQYSYKMRKLRERRQTLIASLSNLMRNGNSSGNYGSIV